MTGADAFRLAERLCKATGRPWLAPWHEARVMIVAVGDALWGQRYSRFGWPFTVMYWPNYIWDETKETYPGEEMANMLSKPVPGPDEKGPGTSLSISPTDRVKYPTLTDHLTQATWEDGSPRETSKLNVWHDGSTYKVMLRDVACSRVLFVAAPHLHDLIAVLEKCLSSPTADWRVDKGPPAKRGGKK